MVAYYWVVWYSRNKFIFEGQKLEPNLLAAKAESILAAYQRVRKPVPAPPDTCRTGKKQKWMPPPEISSKSMWMQLLAVKTKWLCMEL